jgi:pyruvate formate lyase activating enzyme
MQGNIPEIQGIITEIQRFSLKDGPGIRTTVFFKGCNMACPWCHNPETIKAAPELLYTPSRCIGCGHCAAVCPVRAHQMVADRHCFDRSRCIGCGRCAEVCFPDALVMSGMTVSVNDVMQEVRQDMLYYAESGGGVTLSGGEILCQIDFAVAIAQACAAEAIPVALETNLYAPWPLLSRAARSMQLVMCDIKLIDPGAHKRYTGVDNDSVLANARALADCGIGLIVRTPLIPGVTDTETNIAGIAAFVAQLPSVIAYELLNFNPLGAGKYEALGLDNAFRQTKPLPPAELAHLQQVASAAGIPVTVS